MVAKKKSKKPAANPARGFATTSTVSKSKAELAAGETSLQDSASASQPSTPSVALATPSQSVKDLTTASKHDAGTKELHELSPEELEARLNLSELQSVIDAQGTKVKKESSRQVTRLQTDRRVLRAQAELLVVREWLPDEIMQQIIDLTIEEERTNAANGTPTTLKRFSEDELLSRMWQLHLSLTDLDVSEDQIRASLQYILQNPPADEANNFIWGLPEIFDWLAVHSASGEMLDYDAQKPKSQITPTLLGTSSTSARILPCWCLTYIYSRKCSG